MTVPALLSKLPQGNAFCIYTSTHASMNTVAALHVTAAALLLLMHEAMLQDVCMA